LRGRTEATTAPVSSSKTTCSITVRSTPSSFSHSFANRTPFHSLRSDPLQPGIVGVGRRAPRLSSSGHPRKRHKSRETRSSPRLMGIRAGGWRSATSGTAASASCLASRFVSVSQLGWLARPATAANPISTCKSTTNRAARWRSASAGDGLCVATTWCAADRPSTGKETSLAAAVSTMHGRARSAMV